MASIVSLEDSCPREGVNATFFAAVINYLSMRLCGVTAVPSDARCPRESHGEAL